MKSQGKLSKKIKFITIILTVIVISLALFITPINAFLRTHILLIKYAIFYSDIQMTDVHNHDSGHYKRMIPRWNMWSVDRVVLFGSISEPAAIISDEEAWEAYTKYPDIIIPYFSGIDLRDEDCLDVVRDNLERGFFGIGETVAASTYSPFTADLEWKADNPLDGYLPQIYDICAEYNAPILLHIDPPIGEPIEVLESALDGHPDTTFIFAHMNVGQSPESIAHLMREHGNLYIDFYAGYTMLDSDSENTLEDFVPLAKEFSDRFLLSTDSGANLESEAAAVNAMYRFIELLDDDEIASKIAYENYNKIISAQMATDFQLEALSSLEIEYDANITKRDAGKILIEAGFWEGE